METVYIITIREFNYSARVWHDSITYVVIQEIDIVKFGERQFAIGLYTQRGVYFLNKCIADREQIVSMCLTLS